MRKLHRACYALTLFGMVALTASAANLNFFNVPPNVSVQQDANWEGGFSSTQQSPGTINFNGSYQANNPGSVTGVVYIVNPGTNVITAEISITFTAQGGESFPNESVTGQFLTASAGNPLGTVPNGFSSVPANPSSLVPVLASFVDPGTGQPVTLPSNITLFIQSQLSAVPPVITSSSTLPAADSCVNSTTAACSPYSFTATATGTAPITWSIQDSTPPPGLNLNTDLGILSGIINSVPPNEPALFFLAASNAGGASSQAATLLVNPQPSIAASSLPVAIQGQPYQFQLSAVGGTAPFSWTAALSHAGSASFPPNFIPFSTIEYITQPIANGDQLVVGDVTLNSFAAIGKLPLPSAAEETFADAAIQLGPGQTFAGVRIPSAAERNGDFSDFAGLLIDPLTGLPFQGGIIPTSRLSPLFAFRIGPVQGGPNVLPSGLTLSPGGLLSGVPTGAGTFQIALQATDSAQGPTTVLTLLPLTVDALLVPTPVTALPPAEIGAPYSFAFQATGGSGKYSWTTIAGNTLPPGLQLNAAGVLSGTPTQVSNANGFSFGVAVTDGIQNKTQSPVTLQVNQRVHILTPVSLPNGQEGAPYSLIFSASPGVAPYTWKLIGGSLPPGLQLDGSSGTLSGTPGASAGSPFTFTLQVSDNFGITDTANFQLQVLPITSTFTLQIPSQSAPQDQPQVQLSIVSAFPADISGKLALSFNSAVGTDDQGIVFLANNSRTLNFTIPANSKNAVFEGGSSQFQVGTTAGTITVSAVSLQSNGQTFTPITPATTTIGLAGPQIIGKPTGTLSSNQLTVNVTGLCTARQVTTAKFVFAGQNLKTHSFSVDVGQMFTNWYQSTASIQTGSQFTYSQQFAISGDPNDIAWITVALVGPQGETQPVSVQMR